MTDPETNVVNAHTRLRAMPDADEARRAWDRASAEMRRSIDLGCRRSFGLPDPWVTGDLQPLFPQIVFWPWLDKLLAAPGEVRRRLVDTWSVLRHGDHLCHSDEACT